MTSTIPPQIVPSTVNQNPAIRTDIINQPVQTLIKDYSQLDAQAIKHATIIENAQESISAQSPTTLDKIVAGQPKTEVDLSLFTTRIITERPTTTLVPSQTIGTTSLQTFTFQFALKNWTPMKQITIQFPRALYSYFLKGTSAQIAVYNNSYSANIQKMYAFLDSCIRNITVYAGVNRTLLPKPGDSQYGTFYQRLALTLKNKDDYEMKLIANMGLPYQNTMFPCNLQAQQGANGDTTNLMGPDWMTDKEALAMANLYPTNYNQLRMFHIHLSWLYPCLDQDVLLPPGFQFEILIEPSLQQYHSGSDYALPFNITGIPNKITASLLSAGLFNWNYGTAPETSSPEFLNEIAGNTKIAYPSYTLSNEVAKHLTNLIQAGISYPFMHLSMFRFDRGNYEVISGGYRNIVVTLPNNHLPKALIFTPRAKSTVNNVNEYFLPNPGEWLPGGLVNNPNSSRATNTSVGYAAVDEIYPYVINYLKITSTRPNDVLYEMYRESNHSIVRSSINSLSNKQYHIAEELYEINGVNQTYLITGENQAFRTSPYIAYINTNANKNEKDIREILTEKQLLVEIRYQTLTPFTIAPAISWPTNQFAEPGIYDTLEIALLNHSNHIYIKGNSVTFNDIPFQ